MSSTEYPDAEKYMADLLESCEKADVDRMKCIFTEIHSMIESSDHLTTSCFLERGDLFVLYDAALKAGVMDQFIEASDPVVCADDLLCFGAKMGSLELVERAVDGGAGNGEAASCYAAENGHREVFDWITKVLQDGVPFDEALDVATWHN